MSTATSDQSAPCARFQVSHETRTRYQSRVTLSKQHLHLTPRNFAFQTTEVHEITVHPAASESVSGCDYFGNQIRQVAVTSPHRTLLVHAESTVSLTSRAAPLRPAPTPPWESLRDRMQSGTDPALLDAHRYLYASPHVQVSRELAQYAATSYPAGRSQFDAALHLTRRIFSEFEFDSAATDISTPLDAVLRGRRGVCQDFAQLMIGCLRSVGLPARYVSGYLLTHPPMGMPRLIGADASHAWVSVWCSGSGWVDFDPTNNCVVQQEHITLAWGRDFSDVTPMRGVVLGGGKQDLAVRVTVVPLPLASQMSK